MRRLIPRTRRTLECRAACLAMFVFLAIWSRLTLRQDLAFLETAHLFIILESAMRSDY